MFTVKDSLKHFKQWLFYHRKNFGAASYIRNPWIKTITPIALSIVNPDMKMVKKIQDIKGTDLIMGVNPQSDYKTNKRLHPAQDPVEAYLPLIARTPCETVYDPFMGSGTTAMTCLQLGKNYIGSELNPEYIAIANKRINTFEAQETIFGIQEELISE